MRQKHRQKKIITLLFILLFLVFTVITIGNFTITDTNKEHVSKVSGVNFTINGSDISLNKITYTSTYAVFNDTGFNITHMDGDGVNITLANLTDISGASVGSTVLSFYANASSGTVWFNISGFNIGSIYRIRRTTDVIGNITANSTGVVSFSNSVWSTQYFEVIYLTEVTTPIVVTNHTEDAGDRQVTMFGYLQDDGNDTCRVRFQYSRNNTDYNSSGTNTIWQTNKNTGDVFSSVEVLEYGGFYYFRSQTNNSNSIAYGDNESFLVMPSTPTTVGVITYSTNYTDKLRFWINPITGYNSTVIRYSTTSYPTTTSGTEIYNDTVATLSNGAYVINYTDVVPNGTELFFSIWNYAEWNSLFNFSNPDRAMVMSNTQYQNKVHTDNANNVTNTTATLNGNLTELGGSSNTVNFEWGTTTSYSSSTAGFSHGSTTSFITNVTGLTPGQIYYVRTVADNGNIVSRGTDPFNKSLYFDNDNTIWNDPYLPNWIYDYNTDINNNRVPSNVFSSLLSPVDYVTIIWYITDDGSWKSWTTSGDDSNFNINASTDYLVNVNSNCTLTITPNASAFLALPTRPNTLNLSRDNVTIDLTWNNGEGYNRTILERNNTGVASWSRGSGIELYNGTGTSYTDTIEYTSPYYYQAWSYANWTYNPILHNYSSDYASTSIPSTEPNVITNSSTGVEETNATLHGYLVDDGNLTCNVGFDYGTSMSYGSNTTNQSKTMGEKFDDNITGLNRGILYHFRAMANNTNSTQYGIDRVFLTKPINATNSAATQNATNSSDISWTNGLGANNTILERNNTGVASWSRGSGIELYNGTASAFTDTGLEHNVTYYYQSWSWTNWSNNGTTLNQFSDGYNSTTVILIGHPNVTTNSSTGVEETNATLHGYLVDDGGVNNTVWFQYRTNTGSFEMANVSIGVNITDVNVDGYIFNDYNGGNASNDYDDEFIFGAWGGDVGTDIRRGYVEWDISAISDYVNVSKVQFKYDTWLGGDDGHIHDILDIQPSTIYDETSNATLYDDIGSGTLYADEAGFPINDAVGNHTINLSSSSWSDFENKTTDGDWFALGFQGDLETGTNYAGIKTTEEVTANPSPVLYIEYNLSNMSGVTTGTEFSLNLSGLNNGTLYHYRAVANNSISTQYGENITFLTKPQPPSLTVSDGFSPSVLNLSWSLGNGQNTTRIERNTNSVWSRGDGTLVFNNTGSYYNDTNLSMNTLYYYQAWSWTNWSYNPTLNQYSSVFTASNTTDNVDPPYNGSSTYTYPYLNLSWTRGNNSDREIVVKNNNTWATSPTDGWILQNSTNMWYNTSNPTDGYYTIWSYNDTAKLYSSIGLNIDWGAMAISVYNESNMSQGIDGWDIEISNSQSQNVYTAYDQSNILYIDINDIPYGEETIFVITADGYRERISYHDLFINNFYNFTFYLPPYTTPTDPDDPYGDDNESTTRLYRFRVIDEYTYPVADATVQIRRYNNITEEYINISTLITNGYGEEDIWLIPGEHYRAFVSKSDYDSDIFDWIPDPLFYGPDYPKIFQISRTISDEDETYTFWDFIQFNATLFTNGSLFVNYIDFDENTTNAQFYIYEHYNFSSTYITTESTTDNTFSFWVTGLNNSREHEITIYLNHTTLGFEVKSITMLPVGDAKYDEGGEIEKKISNAIGPFSLGYVQTFLIYLPIMFFLVLPGPKHPGFAIIMASIYAGFASSFIVIGSILMIIPFAVAIGMVLMAVKGGLFKL